jgi:hypothetical protein
MATSTTPRTAAAPRLTRSRRHAPPRPFGDGGEAPRRPMAAGHVLVVGVVCLMLGWLLNAQGIEKTAYSQPLGWQRDVGLAFAKPMASISHFLHTDRPREALQDVLGRGGDDDINTKLPSPTTIAGGFAPPVTVPSAFSPQQPLRLWAGGDSLSITPGESILNFAGTTEGVVVPTGPVNGQVATGLARPELLNWPEHLKQVTKDDNPGLIVLTIGSNDDQTLTGAPGGGNVGPFGSAAWEEEYRRRVGGLMDQVVGDGKTLFLVGIPPIRDFERSENDYKLINNIFRTEAAKRPGRVYYVDIYGLFLDGSGNYADYLPNISGEAVKVRADDGIHFTRAGADRIATVVFEKLGKVRDLTSWKKGGAAPTTTAAPATTAPATSTTKGR